MVTKVLVKFLEITLCFRIYRWRWQIICKFAFNNMAMKLALEVNVIRKFQKYIQIYEIRVEPVLREDNF